VSRSQSVIYRLDSESGYCCASCEHYQSPNACALLKTNIESQGECDLWSGEVAFDEVNAARAKPIKRQIKIGGLSIGITHEVGDRRFADAPPLTAAYGHIRGSWGKAVDGMAIDVYIGSDYDSRGIYKVEQLDPNTGELDEYKYFLAFSNPDAVKQFFIKYAGKKRLGNISLTSPDELKEFKEVLSPVVPVLDAAVGKRIGSTIYVHRTALSGLDETISDAIALAKSLAGDKARSANIIKYNKSTSQISFLSYPDFDTNPHPALKKGIVVNLKTKQIKEYVPGVNPPVLHRKETFVLPSYPHYQRFAKLTQQEESSGLLDKTSRIGTQEGWKQVLGRKKVRIVNHLLVRADAKIPQSGRSRSGYTWVDDPTVKGSGFWRKLPNSKAQERQSATDRKKATQSGREAAFSEANAASPFQSGRAIVSHKFLWNEPSSSSSLLTDIKTPPALVEDFPGNSLHQDYLNFHFPSDEELIRATKSPLGQERGTHFVFTSQVGNQQFLLKRTSNVFSRREIVAKRLGELMGLGEHFLPVKEFKQGEENYLAYPFVEGETAFDMKLKRQNPFDNLETEKLQKMVLFDYTINIADRHHNNIYFNTKKDLFLIDNSLTFFDGKWIEEKISSTVDALFETPEVDKLPADNALVLELGNRKVSSLSKRQVRDFLEVEARFQETIAQGFGDRSLELKYYKKRIASLQKALQQDNLDIERFLEQ
jgi:Inorganic Pyrophosphatase